MAELIVYRGSERVTVKPKSDVCYLYRIGPGYVDGGNFVDLNDGHQLNILAEEIRDDYTQWVYSLNESFLAANLVVEKLSLFFLTDLSCKRSEFFETFDLICGLLLIQRQLAGVELSTACLIGVEPGFERAFRSIFPKAEIIVSESAQPQTSAWRRLGSDAFYLLRVAGVVVINAFMKGNVLSSLSADRAFFSVYPQMFSKDGIDTKYGSFYNENDNYAVTILTDGMHQITSLRQYVKWYHEAEKRGFGVIDRHLRISDIASGIFWLGRMWQYLLKQRFRVLSFKAIDISGLMRTEFLFSISRVMRLLVLKGAMGRFLSTISAREIIYYPCEYPLGRMISWVVSTNKPRLVSTGFQMSIASNRRLEQFLAPGEGSLKPPFLKHAPLPNGVLAEDEAAASIYRQAGYSNVAIMDSIYRYAYLDGITPQKKPGLSLIAPGLHDGAMMLEQMRTEMVAHPNNRYLIKPHPRADNDYLSRWTSVNNLQVSTQPIAKLLAMVSRVFVTYSSVGIEAKLLGVDVTIIQVPGRVNASPLLVV